MEILFIFKLSGDMQDKLVPLQALVHMEEEKVFLV